FVGDRVRREVRPGGAARRWRLGREGVLPAGAPAKLGSDPHTYTLSQDGRVRTAGCRRWRRSGKAEQNVDLPPLGPPSDINLPLFVYGLLSPGQLAFSLVEDFVCAQEPATASGVLWLRDGVPLFEPTPDGQVMGHLLWFDPEATDEAWMAVSSFEPAAQYKWTTVEAQAGKSREVANALEGRRVRVGTAGEPAEAWSAASDPVFSEGLEEVCRLVLEAAPHG